MGKIWRSSDEGRDGTINKALLNQAESTFEEKTGGRGETVSLWMTDKVSAARCCLYQLFPHCVWLSRRWMAQRCPQGLERRRTGRGAWRDKNLISLQPFVASPSILPSSNPRRMGDWYYRYRHEELPLFFTVRLMSERQKSAGAPFSFLLASLAFVKTLSSFTRATFCHHAPWSGFKRNQTGPCLPVF